MLGYEYNSIIEKEINMLYKIVIDEKYKPAYNIEKYIHVVTTVHSSKGLQYDQVIILAEDYNLYKHDDLNLHYVAVTRPKDKLLVLCNCEIGNVKNYISFLKINIKKLKELNIEQSINNVIVAENSSEFKTD